ncbi:Fic/DOC family protein [Aeromonas schubertii]|uniref:Fic/DOC family protein n=1 Tax=Aeromonas schubertii TaxID=652 RepID=UPI0010A7A221|nr:Fic family protein [Aeromonas schubertii]QCG47123.1 cell filamentation protein Fic [Aeromonas schubertii]
MDKYGTGQDPYCYEGTQTLINNFNILDEKTLEKAEAEFSLLGIQQINFQQPPYNIEHLKTIHRTIFGKIYPWAGEIRRIDISKGNTHFCITSRVIPETIKTFHKLHQENYLSNLEHKIFVEKFSEYYADFNTIHPFREGNGRVQRVLFEHLALYNGYLIRWELVTKNEWVSANINGVHGYLAPLNEIFSKCLIKL